MKKILTHEVFVLSVIAAIAWALMALLVPLSAYAQDVVTVDPAADPVSAFEALLEAFKAGGYVAAIGIAIGLLVRYLRPRLAGWWAFLETTAGGYAMTAALAILASVGDQLATTGTVSIGLLWSALLIGFGSIATTPGQDERTKAAAAVRRVKKANSVATRAA